MSETMNPPEAPATHVDLPAKYILTDSGTQYFVRRNIPMREMRASDGKIANGVVWRRYDSIYVRKMVVYQLLEEIHVQRTEFLTRRKDIMALTVHTVQGILEKRFRPELNRMIRDSAVFQPLGKQVLEVKSEQIRRFVSDNRNRIAAVRTELLQEPLIAINTDSDLNSAEREQRVNNIRRLIHAIDAETWFFLSIIADSSGRQQLMSSIQNLLLQYTVKFRVGDYVSLMLMELLGYAEQTQLLNFAERDQYIRTHPEALSERFADPTFRQKLFDRAAASNSLLGLNYHFSGNPYSATHRPELEISVSNKGLVGFESRQAITQRRHRGVRDLSLAEFYQHEQPTRFDTMLGMYYLSYVEAACEQIGVRFAAHMTRDERKEEMVTRVYLAL